MFIFGNRYGGIFSEVYKNDFHKNVTYLLVLAKTNEISVIDKSGLEYSGAVLLVKPMVEHAFKETSDPAWYIMLAPHSAFAAVLEQLIGSEDIVALPSNTLAIHGQMCKEDLASSLDIIMKEDLQNIDSRLSLALDLLDAAGPGISLVDISKQCQLSTSRLRVLAKEQLGISLSALLVWRKLVNALKVLSRGSSLSAAAQAGGFSDQPHFTRTMRKMFGVTPNKSARGFRYEN